MAITSIKTGSSFTNLVKHENFLAGNSAFIPNSYESIATVTVGSGGAANVEFTSIPSTYTHLQIRGIAQETRATYGISDGNMQFNGDTASNYSRHNIQGTGSAVVANGDANLSFITLADGMWGTSTGGSFGVSIVDILDYANTNKYKTVRVLSGVDFNGTLAGYGGYVGPLSGNWRNTNAITSIKINAQTGNFTQYSHFALYGIKGA
jgi:hypothetical protein